ncbi:MAG TPA: cytochrome o ubiquinol oxidase subunit IV [Candidatus Saccharimonadales bacterium]|nr:cytochrome o ubiquinol oxidase subunit IV [Candidatus Saccharimonadales bacterium]
MNEQSDAQIVEHESEHLSLGAYIVGFVCSIAITVFAYLLATNSSHSRNVLMLVLATLAIGQFVVQMVFFLHVGNERKPRWKLAIMFLMLLVVLILVGGSLWIMDNLDYRMTPQQIQRYLHSQDSL